MRRPLTTALLAAALAAGAAAPAGAHVDVLPRTMPRDEAVELTVRVPNERPSPTTAVRIAFPPQMTVYSVGAPPPGWRVLIRRAPDGRLSGVDYVGGRIHRDRHADFGLLATPFESGTAVFRTEQAHADGVVSRWTGPPERPDAAAGAEPSRGGPGPAPAVEIGEASAAAGARSGGGIEGAAEEGSGAAIWLGLIAIAIAAGAALATGFLWSTRPARLPADDAPDAGGGAA